MVVIGKVANVDDFRSFLKKLGVRGINFIVKPNWSNAHTFTSAQTLDRLFSALEGRVKVIEGYSAWRNELNTSPEPQDVVTSANAKAKWKWIRTQDKWFMEYSGIESVLAKHDVEYVNVTEEVWLMRTLEPDEVRDMVDSKYGVLVNQEMYSMVPERVYALRGSALISLNNSRRIRGYVSLSTKNLFGLIPDPARYEKWHGKDDKRLSQSIVDINKIYRSIFSPCFWINEIKDKGLFVGGRNSAEADTVTAEIMGSDSTKIDYLRQAITVFGDFDREVLSRVSEYL